MAGRLAAVSGASSHRSAAEWVEQSIHATARLLAGVLTRRDVLVSSRICCESSSSSLFPVLLCTVCHCWSAIAPEPLRVDPVLADHHEGREDRSPRATTRSSSADRTGPFSTPTPDPAANQSDVDVDEPHRAGEHRDPSPPLGSVDALSLASLRLLDERRVRLEREVRARWRSKPARRVRAAPVVVCASRPTVSIRSDAGPPAALRSPRGPQRPTQLRQRGRPAPRVHRLH